MNAVSRDYQQWLQHAQEDWSTVEKLRGFAELRRVCCLHAQPALEKLLKGLLVLHGRTYPKTHDLVELIRLAIDVAAPLGVLEEDLHAISLAYPRSRYPDALNDLTPTEADELLESAAKARVEILKYFPVA